MIIVDYKSSDAGPYSELLFIPGKLHINGGRWHRITKIYVSTMDSVLNGRKNWAIPKELADFKFSQNGNIEEVKVSKGGRTFFRAGMKVWGPRFPVSTKLLPFPLCRVKRAPTSVLISAVRDGGISPRFAALKQIRISFPIYPLQRPLQRFLWIPLILSFPRPKRSALDILIIKNSSLSVRSGFFAYIPSFKLK